MRDFVQAGAILAGGVVRLGPLRLSMYGVCAAVGLVAAMGLSLKTARLVGLAGEQVWDAGLFAVMAAFVCSRLLLVAGNFSAFLKMPGTLLALPSFTALGMVLTGLVVVAYLRWKRLPLLKVLDAWAPCAAVLAAMLSLGKFFEGNDAGMPSRVAVGDQDAVEWWGAGASGGGVCGDCGGGAGGGVDDFAAAEDAEWDGGGCGAGGGRRWWHF